MTDTAGSAQDSIGTLPGAFTEVPEDDIGVNRPGFVDSGLGEPAEDPEGSDEVADVGEPGPFDGGGEPPKSQFTPAPINRALVWDETPPPAQGGGGHAASQRWYQFFVPFLEKPGQWARVAEWSTLRGAERLLTGFSKGKHALPEGLWEMASRRDGQEKSSKLYVKYYGKLGELLSDDIQLAGQLVDRTTNKLFTDSEGKVQRTRVGPVTPAPVAEPGVMLVSTEDSPPLSPEMA